MTDFFTLLLSNRLELIISGIFLYSMMKILDLIIRYLSATMFERVKPSYKASKSRRIDIYLANMINRVLAEVIDHCKDCIRAYVVLASQEKAEVLFEADAVSFSPAGVTGGDIILLEDFIKTGELSPVLQKYGAGGLFIKKLDLRETYYIVIEHKEQLDEQAICYTREHMSAIDVLITLYDDFKHVWGDYEGSTA